MRVRPRSALLCCALVPRLKLALGLALALAASPIRAQENSTTTSRPSPYAWQGSVSNVERSLAVCLRESRLAGDESTTALVEKMVGADRLPKPVIEGLLSILIQGRVPKVKDEDLPQKLSGPQRALVLSALSKLPEKEIRTALALRLDRDPTPEVKLAAMSVLGRIGYGKDFVPLVGWSARDESGQLTRESKDALREALAAILARDAEAFDVALNLLKRNDVDSAQAMLLALADVHHPRGLQACYEVARTRPELARTAVALVPKFDRTSDIELELEFATWARAAIDPEQMEWSRALYGALAVLDEGNAVPELIRALDAEQIGIREVALKSLRSICGVSLPGDKTQWETWFTREVAWFKGPRLRAKTNLATGTVNEVLSALRIYADHRLYRSTLAADIAPSLHHREVPIRELACATLGNLGSRAAVRDLIEKLDDPAPSVGNAAQSALKSIVHGEVPRESRKAREQLLAGL